MSYINDTVTYRDTEIPYVWVQSDMSAREIIVCSNEQFLHKLLEEMTCELERFFVRTPMTRGNIFNLDSLIREILWYLVTTRQLFKSGNHWIYDPKESDIIHKYLNPGARPTDVAHLLLDRFDRLHKPSTEREELFAEAADWEIE